VAAAPPIPRAETVGSMLRPGYLHEARGRARRTAIDPAEYRRIEDRAVDAAIAIQEQAGLDVVTDGEQRRALWVATGGTGYETGLVAGPIRGFESKEIADSENWMTLWRGEEGQEAAAPRPGRWTFITAPMEADFSLAEREYAYLAEHATTRTKYCLPAPSWARIQWHPEFSAGAYPTAEDFLADMRDYIRAQALRAVELGCDYIQLDAPNYAMFHIDPRVRAFFEANGHDLDAELATDAAIDNSVFEGLAAKGVTCAFHVCRGNSAESHVGRGGYDRIAEPLFSRLTDVDTLLLEYDGDRAGDFAPLAQVRPGTTVVLGLVSTKVGALEETDALLARIGEAAAHVPRERLAISPQCGFASIETGNPVSFGAQDAKLRRVVEVARRAWA
jgi:5-methyltetrahydropteroyltriglutamate--homocysteine methyltransferase